MEKEHVRKSRKTDRRDTDDFCSSHEQNTKDITSLKSSTITIKWVISIGLPVLMLILGAFMGNAYNTLKDTLKDLSSDVNQVKIAVNQNTTAAALARQGQQQLKESLEEVKVAVKDYETDLRNRKRNP